MHLPILFEPLSNNSYRAKSGEPIPIVAEATTPDEAMAMVQQAVKTKLESGARLASIAISSEHAWLPFAGMHSADDPVVREWIEIMKEQRDEPESVS